MSNWHTDDDFWVALQGVLFDDQRLAATATEIDGLLSLTGVLPPATILDLGCGPGRHSLELARRGYDVIGVDSCGAYLEQAATVSEEEGLEVEWIEADMRLVSPDRPVDMALSLYSSIGYQGESNDRQFLATVFANLRPGGTFVVETMAQEIFEEGIVSVDSFRADDIYIKRKIHWNGAELVRMNWELHYPDGPVRRYPTEFRIYTRPELEQLLTEAGFSVVDVRGNLQGIPFDSDADLLVLVAVKPRRRQS